MPAPAYGRSATRWCEAANTTDFDIFLSHGHIDHVIGLPFFAPLFVKDQVVRVWAGNLQPAGGVEEAVRKLMSFPFFPLQVDALHAELEFHDFRAGDVDQSPPRHHVADRAAQSSRRRDRLSDRIRRPLGRLCHRHRAGRRPDRSGAAGADQGRGAASSSTRPTPTRNCRRMSAGAIRAGSRASGWPTRPARAGYACSTTIPSTTTPSWTRSRPRPKRRGRARSWRSEGMQVDL